MDNIFIERLWRSVKYEKIFLEEFETVPEFLSGLKDYFEFYNFERPHQSLVGKTTAEIYWGREVARKVYWFSVNWNFPCFELVLKDNPNRRRECVRTERVIRLKKK